MAAVGALLGAVLGFFGGVYLVTALGIQPGDRTDLLVIALVVLALATFGFVIGRRMVRAESPR